MKYPALIFLASAITAVASAQTTPSAPTGAKTTAATTMATKTSASAIATAKPSTTTSSSTTLPWVKLPPGVPVVPHGPVKVPFSLRYEDIKVGIGPLAEPHKVYRVKYTGWLAADGHKFDSSDDHPPEPVYDSSLKPVKGDDGKPKMEAGQPILFMQGRPGMIPGWDLGFEGMHVGGKRRLFVPYQMAYGELGRPSADPKNPGIPPKADLIFDIELVEMMEPPTPQPRPVMPGALQPHPGASATPPHPGAPGQPAASGAAPASPAGSTTSSAPASAATKPDAPPQPTAPPATSAPAQPAVPSTAPASSAPAQPQSK